MDMDKSQYSVLINIYHKVINCSEWGVNLWWIIQYFCLRQITPVLFNVWLLFLWAPVIVNVNLQASFPTYIYLIDNESVKIHSPKKKVKSEKTSNKKSIWL